MKRFLFSTFLVAAATFAQSVSAESDPAQATLERIRTSAMQSDWAFERLADLTDKIGPRLSGSPQAEAAVQQVAAAMRAAGFNVSLQPVRVPHWVRGIETGEITDYPGRPGKLTQKLHLTALGGSVATAANGVLAQVGS